ncbi:hypothetical protein WICPIJ_004315 [Wickerhamomyces pijperi]|uniref:Uncharacterized protein n=1 Tax=Wickerhamomyces pijperi TaxID=599730 RepID=A0A9P8Q893_WICPI|nr:hypothetical protein WICPIJ_004315 [Wickerhamomyces pijperi]
MRPPLFKDADSSHKLAIGAQDLEDLQRSPINIHRNTFTYLPVDLDKEISSLVLLQPGSVSNAFAGRYCPNQIDADDDSPSPILSPSVPLDNFSLSPEEDQPFSSRTNFFLSLRHRLPLSSRKHHRDIADNEGSDSGSDSSESSLDFDATLINAHRGLTQYIEVDEELGSINDASIARRADGVDEPTATTSSHFFSRLFNGLLTTRKVKGDSHHKSSLRRIQKTLGFGTKSVSDEESISYDERPPSRNGFVTVASGRNSGTSTKRSASESPSYDIALPKRDLSPASTRSTLQLFSLFTKEPVRIRRDTRSEKLKFIRLMEQRCARRVRSASYAEQLSSISAEDSVSLSRNHSAQDNVFPTLIDTFYALVRPTDRDGNSMIGSGSTGSSSSNGSNRIPRENQEPISYVISLPTPIEGTRAFTEPVTTLERRFFDIDMQMRIRQLNVANAKTDDISVLQENVHPPTQIDPIDEMLGDFDHVFPEEPPQPLPTLEEKSLLEQDLSSLEFESPKDCSGKTDSSFSSFAKSLRSLFRIRKRQSQQLVDVNPIYTVH